MHSTHRPRENRRGVQGNFFNKIWGIEFLLGICMITAAFPTIWMNERRQVRFYKLTSKADEECVDVQETIDDKSPVLNYNDTKLVRMHGKI